MYWSLKVNSTRSRVTSWKRRITLLYCFTTLYSQDTMSTHRENEWKKKTFGRPLKSRTWQNSPQQRQLYGALGNSTAHATAAIPWQRSPEGLCFSPSDVWQRVLLLCCPGCHIRSSSNPLCPGIGSWNYRYMQPCPSVLVLKDTIELSALYHNRMHIMPSGQLFLPIKHQLIKKKI